MNEPDGRRGSLSPAAGPTDRLRHRRDGVVLADDALVQLVLHVDEPCGLLFGEPVNGDAGPLSQDLGDLLLVDHPAGFTSRWPP